MKGVVLTVTRAWRAALARAELAGAAVGVALALAGCDFAIYNADAISSARAADGMEEIASDTVEGWGYDRWSEDERNLPDAFFPFTSGTVDGYLVTRYDGELDIRIINDGKGEGGFNVQLPGDSGWDAWVVPRDPEKPWTPPADAFSGYDRFRPLLVAVTGHDGPELYLYDADPVDRSGGSLDAIDLPTLVDETVGALFDATPGAFTIPADFVAANAVHLQGPPSGDFPGFPWDALMIELLALSPQTGQIGEYLMLLDADQIKEVVDGTFVRGSTLAAPGEARFPLPVGAQETPPDHLGYAFSPETGIAYLGYRDTSGDAATITWDTFAASAVPFDLDRPIAAGPITQTGLLRSDRTGRVALLDADGRRTTRDLGSLWYAGQYLRGETLQDLYTYIGAAVSGDVADLVVTVFAD